MRILVTGVAGFIGSHVADALLRRGDEVVGIDCINEYYDPALKMARLSRLGITEEGLSWNKVCISAKKVGFWFVRTRIEEEIDFQKIFKLGPFDRIVHLAAQAGVRYSIDHPHEYIDSNIVAFLNVLEASRHAQVPHLIYASSSSVYGLNDTRPFSVHDHTDHPASLYAATKKANELMAHAYSHLYNLPTSGLRFFTVYGPWGRPDMAYFKFAKSIMAGVPIDVYNYGDMWRDFTYIDDIVEGVLRVVDRIPKSDPSWNAAQPDPAASPAPYKVYNIGNNQPVRISKFVEILEKALNKKAVINLLPMQQGDVYATEAEVSDLERDFGWRPSTELSIGLQNFAEWFINLY